MGLKFLCLRLPTVGFCKTCWPIVMYHHTKFGYKRISNWGDIMYLDEHSLEFWTFLVTLTMTITLAKQSNPFTRQSSWWWVAVKPSFLIAKRSAVQDILKGHILIIWSLTLTLTLKTSNQSFWKTVWLMMIYQHTKFGNKRLSNSEKHSLTFWNFVVTLTLNTVIQFLDKTLWLMIMFYQTKFGCKRISSSEAIVETVIFDHITLAVVLTLKTANQSFRTTLQLMMMHHNTKFGNKYLAL